MTQPKYPSHNLNRKDEVIAKHLASKKSKTRLAHTKSYIQNSFFSLSGPHLHWSDPKMLDVYKARATVSGAGRTSLFTYVNSMGGTNRYFIIKRLMDIVVSLAVLIFTGFMLLLIALLIKLDSKGPVIFKQERLTARRVFKDGQYIWVIVPFTVYKFRTMTHNAPSHIHREFTKAFIQNDLNKMDALQNTDKRQTGTYKLNNDSRITRVGGILRRTSLDELPQFLNVLFGDMSLVGPRPPLDYEVEEYQDWQMLRLACKQGITGYWQVIGRSESTFENMVKQDIWYAYHQNLWLDIKILLKTPLAVFKGKGAG